MAAQSASTWRRQVRETLILILPSGQVQALGPDDAFAITLRISVVIGIILAMPVLLYQLWAFVAPGLTAGERRMLRPWVPLALFFFALGVGIAWFVLPFAITFLLQFTDQYLIADRLAAVPYFDFVTTLFLAFGLVMEFPIVLYGLSRVGIATSDRLRASRRVVDPRSSRSSPRSPLPAATSSARSSSAGRCTSCSS